MTRMVIGGVVIVLAAAAGLPRLSQAPGHVPAPTQPSLADGVALSIVNRAREARPAEPVTSGVPIAAGTLRDTAQLRVLQDGQEIPAQFFVTARWPDNSIRWLLLDVLADLPAGGSRVVILQSGAPARPLSGITVRDEPGALTIDTGAATFVFAKSEFRVRDSRFAVESGGTTYRASGGTWTIEEQGPVKVAVRVDGGWSDGSGRELANPHNRHRARLTFFRGRAEARVSLTVRNTNSFGWGTAGEGDRRAEDLTLQGANFGPAVLLPAGQTYRFGSGVETTWDLDVQADGQASVRRSRFDATGAPLTGDQWPRPLAVAPPAYYASTRAWGRIGLPVRGLADEDRQTDFDRFERIQLAKVDAGAVEDPPGLAGTTVWGHLSQDSGSWHDYGDLRWDGNGCGVFSGNHYDWGYGMFLQYMRTGTLAFADAGRVFARHETDFDVYHTDRDGPAYNFQKHWEDRPTHDNPGNCFGPGRPSHTWSQGYALLWLLTGDRRGKDAFDEVQEGVRQFVYESFNGEGRIDTAEIRIQGWLLENLVNRWRIEPDAVLTTTGFGAKSLPVVMQDVLRTVFEREEAAGRQGFVVYEDSGDGHVRQPLVHAYFLEPAIKAHDEVFAGRDDQYAAALLGLTRRMTAWLMGVTYGGDRDADGRYRPRQIPYWVDTRRSQHEEGQIPYLLMVANAAGYLYEVSGEAALRDYARAAFRDYVRYVGAVGPDAYTDAAARTPASYNSNIFTGTESKIHGWSSRYGQYFLASEAPAGSARTSR